MRRKKASKIRAFFLEVYKERLKRRFIFHIPENIVIRNLCKKFKRLLRLNRRFGFFEYGSAPKMYDKESKMLSFYGYWLSSINYLLIFIII